MSSIGAVDVELVGIGVPLRITVGGCQVDDDLRARGNGRAAEVERLNGVTERRVRNRRVIPKELFDRGRDLRWVGTQVFELLGITEQGDNAVLDEAGRRVVPR